MSSTHQVRIVEVGPRDGLQNIDTPIPTDMKLKLIELLKETGLKTIELSSVVSPRVIPQLADCREVLRNPAVSTMLENSTIRLPVLVPNLKGLDIAIQHKVREVAVFISATEGFSKANINCTVSQGIERATQVINKARTAKIDVRGYVSCIFTDPYDGPTPLPAVLRCVRALLSSGCYEVSLGDTLGVGSPSKVRELIQYLIHNGIPVDVLAGHFHDTYGQAVANVWEAYNNGLRVFDSSVAGLGGCPFAPGAKGNVASEDLVYMFRNAGVETGVDLSKLVETGVWISKQLSKSNSSRAGTAIATKAQSTVDRISKSVKPKHAPRLNWDLFMETDGLQVYRTTMIADLTRVISEASSDASISRIIITANGQFFCAGMDLGKGSTPVGKSGSSSDAQFHRLTDLFEAIDQSPKVTIAAINGPACGGGVGLTFSCDILVLTQNANLTFSEVKLGLCAETISKYVTREWGVAFTREAMLSARPVAPGELKALGAVSGIVRDQDHLQSSIDALLIRLKAASRNASRMSKELVRLAWADGGGEKQRSGIQHLFDEMMRSDGDGAHGVREFQSKRNVDWDAYVQRKGASKL
ncbi:hypothetical protein N7540_004427 [Penicillium herquei]|nr:hypothetical protein N7540_004427 [Penicillium herquei]